MKAKSIMVIISTLVIGFVIGYLVSAQITKSKIQNVVKLGMAEGFSNRVYHLIDPTNEQKEKIQPIIEKYAESNAEITQEFSSKLKEQIDNFNTEIEPFLNEDQKERLEMMDQRMRDFHRGSPGGGPGFHGKGGPYKMFNNMHSEILENLELSDSQRILVNEIEDSFRTQMFEIRQNQNGHDENMKLIRKLMKQKEMQIKKVLTDDQIIVYDKHVNEMRKEGNRPPWDE